MVYVEDLVGAVVSAVDRETTGVIDVCSGNASPIDVLYDSVAAELGVTERAERVEAGADDVPMMRLNPALAYRLLDWRSTTSLDVGVARAVAWYRANGVAETFTHLALKG
jgi:nucleoside-diphosphate-sugar epimerase